MNKMVSFVLKFFSKLRVDKTRYIPSTRREEYFKDVDIDGVTCEYYKKSWANDSKKNNEACLISLIDCPEKGYFEVIKDDEPGFYSCHFKTITKSGFHLEKGYATKPITDLDKEILFRALIECLPVGSKLSTRGNVSRGGLNALLNLGTRSNGKLVKVGERLVKDELDKEEITIPIWKKIL